MVTRWCTHKRRIMGKCESDWSAWGYDEAKRFAEAMTMAYHRYHVETRIVRIFNTYGPRMRVEDGRVAHFYYSGTAGEPLTVFGEGRQTRSFCFVKD